MNFVVEFFSYLVGGPLLYTIVYLLFLPFYLVIEMTMFIILLTIKRAKSNVFIYNYLQVNKVRYLVIVIIGTLLSVIHYEIKGLSILIDRVFDYYIINYITVNQLGIFISMLLLMIFFSNTSNIKHKISYFFKPLNLFSIAINAFFIAIFLYTFINAAMSV